MIDKVHHRGVAHDGGTVTTHDPVLPRWKQYELPTITLRLDGQHVRLSRVVSERKVMWDFYRLCQLTEWKYLIEPYLA